MQRILHITLKKQYFDMIASGEKKEEYREIKEHWVPQLLQLKQPLVLDNAGIRYDNITRAFAFCWGFKNGKVPALNYLLNELKIAEFKPYTTVSANNGYQKDCPNIKWQHKGIRIGEGKPEWGAEPGKQYFILEIGELIT